MVTRRPDGYHTLLDNGGGPPRLPVRSRGPLFARLRTVGTERDRAGTRLLFSDQYATLMLLYFFNPTVTSLRGLQQTTTLTKVQERLGVRLGCLWMLLRAAYVFDAALLYEILTTLGAPLRPHMASHCDPRSKRRPSGGLLS